MMRAMHERAAGGVNGLLARGWKEATSTHQKVGYSSSESRARIGRSVTGTAPLHAARAQPGALPA